MLANHKLGLRELTAMIALFAAGCAQASGGASPPSSASNGGSAGTTSRVDDGGAPSGGGSGGLFVDAGSGGSFQGVVETCEQSEQARSYIGCEYFPTVTPNSQLSGVFHFAIAAANPTKTEAVVTVERAGVELAKMTIAPGSLGTTTLPWVEELKQTRPTPNIQMKSARVDGGAFHVTSSVPIVLYQFNPLEYKAPIPPEVGCQIDLDENACLSFSNDASLLLPTSALRNDYFVVTRPSFHLGNEFPTNTSWTDFPGFVSVTATADDTIVNVKSTARVRAGAGGSGDSFWRHPELHARCGRCGAARCR